MTAKKTDAVKYGKITVITDAAELRTFNAETNKRAGTVQNRYHRGGVSALYHAMKHGDTTLLWELFEDMPRGQRRLAFLEWAVAHAPLDKQDDGTYKLRKGRTEADFDIVGAAENPFWDFTDEKPPIVKGEDALIKVLQGYAKGGTERSPVDDAGKAAAIKALKALGVQPEVAKAA